ncbi:hypothetical protein BHE74_00031314 [Ensete ventricosum]|nr:hypothetical protein BHE74_00031314 [Ensete ventricosum]RZS04906.1 hypothetical protein BHM03_00035306 [Ensete ventricosum]
MANPSFSSGEAPAKMVERCKRCDFFENSAKRSLCPSATETSASMSYPRCWQPRPRSRKFRRTLRLLRLGRATVRLVARGSAPVVRQVVGEFAESYDGGNDPFAAAHAAMCQEVQDLVLTANGALKEEDVRFAIVLQREDIGVQRRNQVVE